MGEPTFTSIVIPIRNQLDYTNVCLESIRQYTSLPYELILIDNGSKAEEIEALRAQKDIILIENRENRGFAAACNQGINRAGGENILLLNNDVVVTEGWLEGMHQVLSQDSSTGLVGPRTNNISGKQKVASAKYDGLTEMHEFARTFSSRHKGESFQVQRIVAFCLLFKREVIRKIGLLDERFGPGCFEDDDFCFRARLAGFRLMVAGDVFVHHYGSRTFTGEGIDLEKAVKENQERFLEKWHGKEAHASVASAMDGEKLEPEKAKGGSSDSGNSSRHLLSVCMIAKDEEDTIADSLRAVNDFADEIIVIDTGSKDRTPAIAESFGARVLHHSWKDDFSEARNVSLDAARGEWILVLDADEIVAPGSKEILLSALQDEGKIAYHLVFENIYDSGETIDCLLMRLFRNRKEIRFRNAIHEQVLPSLRKYALEHQMEFGSLPLRVIHRGYLKKRIHNKDKDRRNLLLYEKQLEQYPKDIYSWYKYADFLRRFENRYDFFRAACRGYRLLNKMPGKEAAALPFSGDLIGLFALGLLNRKRWPTAYRICLEGLEKFDPSPNLFYITGALAFRLGKYDEAISFYKKCMAYHGKKLMIPARTGVTTYLSLHGVGEVYQAMGKKKQAEAFFNKAIEMRPEFLKGVLSIANLKFQKKHFREGMEVLTNYLKRNPKCVEAWKHGAQALSLMGLYDRALQWYGTACSQDDASPELLFQLGRHFLLTGNLKMAYACWEESKADPRSQVGVLLIHQVTGDAFDMVFDMSVDQVKEVFLTLCQDLFRGEQHEALEAIRRRSPSLEAFLPGLEELIPQSQDV